MFTKLKNALKMKRKPQTVESKIYHKPDKDQFVVAYGHQKRNPTSIGTGNTLPEALKDTANVINQAKRQPARTRRKLLENTQETSLELDLYYNEIEENYTFTITDHTGKEAIGTGRSTSRAIKDLAENTTLEKE